jgi:hypothetical protein
MRDHTGTETDYENIIVIKIHKTGKDVCQSVRR